jgi:hypothetical protein
MTFKHLKVDDLAGVTAGFAAEIAASASPIYRAVEERLIAARYRRSGRFVAADNWERAR